MPPEHPPKASPKSPAAAKPKGKLAEAALVAARAARRYPAELLAAARSHDPTHAAEEFQAAWRAAPSAAAWLGHCTVLLKVGGTTILTDPVWARRIGVRLVGRTIGVARLHAPPLALEALPPVDLILLSHAHFDHLDRPTLRHLLHLSTGPRTRIITATNTARLVPRGFAQIDELGWQRSLTHNNLSITAIEPNHWGARTAWDRHRGFNSYLIGAPASPTVLFAGDTALTEAFDHLSPSGVDLAIMGIGAYDPWVKAHATPEQVWHMATRMNARRLLPVHFGTFKLSDEPAHEPMARLLTAAGTAHARIGPEIVAPQILVPQILAPTLAHVHDLTPPAST